MAWIDRHIKRTRKGFTARLHSRITLKFNGICQRCGKIGKLKIVAGCYVRAYEQRRKTWRGKQISFEVHHIIPVDFGGSNDDGNLTLLCRRCHRSKAHTKNGLD